MVRRRCFAGAVGALVLFAGPAFADPGGAGGSAGAGGSSGAKGGSAGASGKSGGAGGSAALVTTVKPGGTIAGKGSKTAILAASCLGNGADKCGAATPLVWDKTVQLSEIAGIKLPDFDTSWLLAGDSGAAAGMACGGDGDCNDGDFYCDTGECRKKPSDPLDLRFFLKFPASTHIHMEGTLVASWPDPITVAITGNRDTGELDFDYGIKAGGVFHYGFSVFGDDFGNGNNGQAIPDFPDVDYEVKGQRVFDPFAYDPAIEAEGQSPEITLFKVPLTSAILPLPGVDAGIELNVNAEVKVDYQTKQTVVTPFPDKLKPVGAVITTPDGTVLDDWQQGAWAEYLVRPEGTATYKGTIHLKPTFYIEVSDFGLSDKFEIPVYDYPIDLGSAEVPWTFDDQQVHVPLPDIRPPATQPTLDAPVTVGGFDVISVPITNVGEEVLDIQASMSSSEFQVITTHVQVKPGAQSLIGVRFSPTDAGAANAVLRLVTNDPDTPELDIPLTATADPDTTMPYMDPPPPPPADHGVGGAAAGGSAGAGGTATHKKANNALTFDPNQDGGCGCRVAGDSQGSSGAPSVLALSALAYVVSARRRARRTAPPKKECLS